MDLAVQELPRHPRLPFPPRRGPTGSTVAPPTPVFKSKIPVGSVLRRKSLCRSSFWKEIGLETKHELRLRSSDFRNPEPQFLTHKSNWSLLVNASKAPASGKDRAKGGRLSADPLFSFIGLALRMVAQLRRPTPTQPKPLILRTRWFPQEGGLPARGGR